MEYYVLTVYFNMEPHLLLKDDILDAFIEDACNQQDPEELFGCLVLPDWVSSSFHQVGEVYFTNSDWGLDKTLPVIELDGSKMILMGTETSFQALNDNDFLPYLLLRNMGIERFLFLSTAVSLKAVYKPGTAFAVTDHLSRFGYHFEGLKRFFPIATPEMTEVYPQGLLSGFVNAASESGYTVRLGSAYYNGTPVLMTPLEVQTQIPEECDFILHDYVEQCAFIHGLGGCVLSAGIISSQMARGKVVFDVEDENYFIRDLIKVLPAILTELNKSLK